MSQFSSSSSIVFTTIISSCWGGIFFMSYTKTHSLVRVEKTVKAELDELGKMLEISKERVCQIETRALRKLQKKILQISQQKKQFFI